MTPVSQGHSDLTHPCHPRAASGLVRQVRTSGRHLFPTPHRTTTFPHPLEQLLSQQQTWHLVGKMGGKQDWWDGEGLLLRTVGAPLCIRPRELSSLEASARSAHGMNGTS